MKAGKCFRCLLIISCVPLLGIHPSDCDAQQPRRTGQVGKVVVIKDEDFKSQPHSSRISLEDLGLNQPESKTLQPLDFQLESVTPIQESNEPFASSSSGILSQQPQKQTRRIRDTGDVIRTDAKKIDQEAQNRSDKQLGQKPPNAEFTERSTENPSEQSDAVKDEDAGKDSNHNSWSVRNLTDRKSLPSTVQMIISVAAISLVPAILLMTTCFIRIVVVLGILRQAIGLQQLPPAQVTTALALMLTFLIMAPTWKQVKQEAIDPYSAEGSTMSWDEAWEKGVTPIKKFMWQQIQRAENENDFWIFYDYLPQEERSQEPTSFEEIPLKVLLPAFMISELKVAFLIGIQVLLPFLILDIVVASLCNTMGLIMMPPTVVSLPLKLLLFVMVDGWNLIVAMLLESFSQIS